MPLNPQKPRTCLTQAGPVAVSRWPIVSWYTAHAVDEPLDNGGPAPERAGVPGSRARLSGPRWMASPAATRL
jgi:hypothetical protein